MTGAMACQRGAAQGGGYAGGPESESLRERLEELKQIYPPMIVRFPEDNRLARLDRRLTLRLTSIPWGPFAQVVLLCGHIFNAPWNALVTIPLVVYALEAPRLWGLLAWVAAGLTALPIFLLLRDKISRDFFWSGAHLLLAFLGVLAWLWAVDSQAFQASCLYGAGWLYSGQLTYLLKGLAGRRRPALAMSAEVAKLLRSPLWAPAIASQIDGDNAYHSFPSGDAAAAACFASAVHLGLREAHLLAFLLAALATYGRVYVFAHHLLDVVAGAALGVACTSALAAIAGPDGYHELLAWSVFSVSSIHALFLAGPLRTLLVASAAFALLGRTAGCCLAAPVCYTVLMLVGYLLYVRTSYDQKDWVVEHLEEFFSCLLIQEKGLPLNLQKCLEQKRAEIRSRAAEPGSAFPSDIYSLYAYAPSGGVGPKPFAADWCSVASLMAARLEDFERQTGLELSRVDVVLGIYTGGALLAPLVAARLGCGVCYIRVSRYSDDVIGVWGCLRTLLQKFSGRHEGLYRVSEAPGRALLEGKVVLMVDDAVGTGGTFREAHKFCMQVGAQDARGVALDSIAPGRHVWDLSLPQPKPQKLAVPCFLPWGLR